MGANHNRLEGVVNNLLETIQQSHKQLTCVWDYTWEPIWGTLEDVFKGANKEAKSDPFKCDDKDILFSAPVDAQESANRTKMHEFEGAFDGIIKSAPYSALRDLNKDEQEGAEVALKGALEVALVHNTCQCRSVYRMI